MSREMWKAVETGTEKTRIEKTKRWKDEKWTREIKERSRVTEEREKTTKKQKKWRKIEVKRLVEEQETWNKKEKTKKLVLEVNLHFLQEGKWADTYQKNIRPYNRPEKGICAKK